MNENKHTEHVMNYAELLNTLNTTVNLIPQLQLPSTEHKNCQVFRMHHALLCRNRKTTTTNSQR